MTNKSGRERQRRSLPFLFHKEIVMPTDYGSIPAEKLLERRLDYAWRYFDSAAQKRMQFVNYFVLLVGILANAYVLAVNQGRFAIVLGVCTFGIVCSLTFIVL